MTDDQLSLCGDAACSTVRKQNTTTPLNSTTSKTYLHICLALVGSVDSEWLRECSAKRKGLFDGNAKHQKSSNYSVYGNRYIFLRWLKYIMLWVLFSSAM